ncbi:MAG: hypothetical protein WCS75_12905 [Sphingomonas sp.]|jgi:hypothetical protein|uniref:hypothetical protein n=1 Tax=Sphingomonas sp. TaxID=28214 RepID=UPI003566887A
MVANVTPPIGYVTIYNDKAVALAARDRLRSNGTYADVYGGASKVLVAEDYSTSGGHDFIASDPGNAAVFILVAAMMHLQP